MLLGLLVLLILLSLYQVKLNLNGFHEDYLSKDKTNAIKGIFILLVFLSHAMKHISRCGYGFDHLGDPIYRSFFMGFAQLVVVMFLFYSGYGVCESFKRKGASYAHNMPRHRLLGTLLNFDIAVLVFVVLNLVLGISMTSGQVVASLFAWDSVGNDNWYIFVILLCYALTYVVLSIGRMKLEHRAFLLFALCLVSIVVLAQLKSDRWYNTLLCYPLGFLYSTYKEPLEAFLKRTYWATLALLVAVLLGIFALFMLHALPKLCQLPYNVFCIVFVMIVVLLTMKVGIGNAPLRWAGVHLFPIFIYMRLPMIVMEQKTPALVGTHPALFIVIALAVTLLIARCYKHWEVRL